MTQTLDRLPELEKDETRPLPSLITKLALLLVMVAASTLMIGTQAAQAAPSSYTYYQVVARHSDKCLDVAFALKGDGTDVIQGSCWGGTNQQWYLRPMGNDGYYEMVARHSQKCLDVEHDSRFHGANVIQWTCHGGGNQQWYLRPVGVYGYYEVVGRNSGMCLDVENISQDHMANVIQGMCWGGLNQQRRFF